MHRLSTVGRPVELRYPTNLAITVLALLCLLVCAFLGLASGSSWSQSLLHGLTLAGVLFLAWALGRETDPDRQMPAFLAAGGALALALLLGAPALLVAFWCLVAVRLFNRSPGADPGVFDTVGFTGLSVWLGIQFHWAFSIMAVPPIAWAATGNGRRAHRLGLALLLLTVAAMLAYVRRPILTAIRWRDPETTAAAVLFMAVIPAIIGHRSVRSLGDRDGLPLQPARLRAALIWAASLIVVLSVVGVGGPRVLSPLWAALAATSLGSLLGWLAERVR